MPDNHAVITVKKDHIRFTTTNHFSGSEPIKNHDVDELVMHIMQELRENHGVKTFEVIHYGKDK